MSENTTVDQYLNELEIAKEDIKQAIERKGATVSGGLSSYAGFIDALETVDPRQQLPNGICFEGSTIDVFDLSPYDWSMVYDYSEMFKDCTNLTGFGDDLGNAFENMLVCNNMFGGCTSLTSIPQLDTSKVVDMNYMFQNCSKLINIPQLDTSSVASMNYMFQNCSKLATIPQLDTSKVVGMRGMFESCSSLQSIPQLDTSNVTDMSSMFSSCSKLQSIPQLNTSNVTDMSSMFSSCSKLQSIPQLNTSSVTIMGSMFYGCTSLTSIPLLDCSSVTDTSSPFGYGNLNTLTDLGGFKDLKVSWSSNFLDRVPNATVESLMNVINNLYDLTANGLSGQTLKFGTTNLNKLTAEQKVVATNKGWTLT